MLFYFDPEVQELYIEKDPRAQIPVLLNDVVFALHALFACIITGIQCFFYEVLLLFIYKVFNWRRFLERSTKSVFYLHGMEWYFVVVLGWYFDCYIV